MPTLAIGALSRAGSLVTRRMAVAVSAMLCVSTAGAPVSSQEPAPIFRAQVDLVQVEAYVTDSRGNPVTDLTADDFDIREDGVPQVAVSFESVNVPLVSRGDDDTPEPDVRTNTAEEGRLYVIAVDDLTPAMALRARVILRQFVEQHMGANDLACLVLLGKGRREDAQELTSSRRLLLRAIDRLSGWPEPVAEEAAAAQASAGSVFVRALRDLTEALARVPVRRKAMLLVSEDVHVDTYNAIDTPPSASTENHETQIALEAIRAALRGNTAIYPIHPGGALGQGMLSRTRFRGMGEVTGGFAHIGSNAFGDAFARVVRENSAYYVLRFYSTNERRDGGFRRIDVRVRRPGVDVHAARGYLAPRDRGPAPSLPRTGIREVLAHPLATSGLPLRVAASAYRADRRTARLAVALEIEADRLTFEKRGDVFTAVLEVGYVATSATRTSAETRYTINLALAPATYEQVRKTGLRVLLETRLPTGVHQLRVGAAQVDGPSGSVVYDVEVPDFEKEPLTMSGVSLTSDVASAIHTASGNGTLRDAIRGPITATRAFGADDRLTLSTEVYGNLREANTITLRTELRDTGGRVVREVTQSGPFSGRQAQTGGHAFTTVLPLAGLSAGQYVIHVQASAGIEDGALVSRDIPIRITAP